MKAFLLLLLLLPAGSVAAQVIKQAVVEHFTNTSCSFCASGNPVIHSYVAAGTYVNHVSFHPSSPYVNDVFNQQNMAENDTRTNYYGVYGSTPKVVYNGQVISATLLDDSIAATDGIAMSNFDLRVRFAGSGSETVVVTIKKLAEDPASDAVLFAGLLEDTVFQTTSNGETTHLNVFRRALTAVQGAAVVLPEAVGDSVQLSFSVSIEPAWVPSRIAAMVILQQPDKVVINSARSANYEAIATTGEMAGSDVLLFPNPAESWIKLTLNETTVVKITDWQGRVVLLKTLLSGERLSIEDLKSGMYQLSYSREGMPAHHPFIKY